MTTWSLPKFKRQLRGPLAFPITPYAADGSVDLAAVARNVDWLPGTGISAIVAPSGTGECFALTSDESLAVMRATVQTVAGRLPVIGSVGISAHAGADLATAAESAGVDALLMLPPAYATPDPRGLLRYYSEIAAATGLAVLPYARDAAAFTPGLVERLALDIPNLVAFKDGRGDVRLFQRIREHVTERFGADRLVWLAGVGDDLVAPYFAAGAEGFTSSLACFWPEAAAELFRLASAGDFAQLRSFETRAVRPFYELRQAGLGFEVAVMKAAMEILGHPAGAPRPPLGQLSDTQRVDLSAILDWLHVPTATLRGRELAALNA